MGDAAHALFDDAAAEAVHAFMEQVEERRPIQGREDAARGEGRVPVEFGGRPCRPRRPRVMESAGWETWKQGAQGPAHELEDGLGGDSPVMNTGCLREARRQGHEAVIEEPQVLWNALYWITLRRVIGDGRWPGGRSSRAWEP